MTRARRLTVVLSLFLGAGLCLAVPACEEESPAAPPGDSPSFLFENPLRDAEPGEWARYSLYDGEGPLWTIIYRGMNPGTLAYTVEEETRDPETEVVQSRESRTLHPNYFLRGFDTAGMVITRIYPETIFVAGREWDCLCVEFLGRLQGTVRGWYSNEVPAQGLVRQVAVRGEELLVTAELIDWSNRQR